MSVEKFPAFFEGSIEGDMKWSNVLVGKSIGGIYNPSRIAINFERNKLQKNPSKAILEFGAIVKSNSNPSWKIWFDGVSLMKEFKPNCKLTTGKIQYVASIFDVTPLVKRESPKKTHKLVVVSTSDEIFLTHATLLKFFENYEKKAYVQYRAGGLPIEPFSEAKFNFNNSLHDARRNRILSNFILHTNSSMVEFIANKKILKSFELSRKIEEVDFEFDIQNLNELSIKYMPEEGKKEMIISNLIVVSTNAIVQDVEFMVDFKKMEEDYVSLDCKILNKSNSSISSALITVIARGTLVARKQIKELESMKEVHEKFSFKVPKDTSTLFIRLIWKKDEEPYYIEKKLKI